MGSGSFLIVIPFILAAVLSLVLAGAAWRRARSPGSLSFTLAMLSCAVWLFAAAMEASATVPAEIITWAKVAYLGIVWLAPLWLLFVMEFIYPAGRFATRLGPALMVVPLVTLSLVMTNESHWLIWREISPVEGATYLTFKHGPGYWAFAGYCYALLAASAIMLARGLARLPRSRHAQLIGLLAGLALPWFGNAVYLSGWLGTANFDLTPFGLALSGLVLSWAFFRQGMFQHTPLAYETIIENISDGFLLFDRQERLIEVNTAARRMLHLSPGQPMGQPAGEALAGWPDLLRLLRFEKNGRGEILTEAIALEANLSTWVDGDRAAGKLIVLHDVTHRRRIEMDLRASERLYRQLVDAAPVGIMRLDRAGKITFASPMIYEQYQMESNADLVGRSPLELIHPQDRETAAERVQKALRGETLTNPQEYRLLRADGSVFWGESVSSPIVDENGEPQGMLSISHDVSARKVLETSLQRSLSRQTFINDLLQTLYRAHDLPAALGIALGRAGAFFAAAQVCLWKDSPESGQAVLLAGWNAGRRMSTAPESPRARLANVVGWREAVEMQGSLVAHGNGVASCAVFPIYGSAERLYGHLMIDHTAGPRAWDSDDLGLMNVVCGILSGAVARIQSEEAEQRQRALAESLHDSAAALNSTLNLEEVLDRILTNLKRVVPGVAASIAMMDDDEDLRFVRWRGYDHAGDELMRTARLKVNDRHTYAVMAKTGEPITIGDTRQDPRWVEHPAVKWIRSFAGAPIRLKGKVVGFINLDSPEPNYFSDDLSYSLRVFADQAALAIENARLYDAAHRRAEEMSILYRIGLTLTGGLETGQVLMSLYDECRQVLPIDVFSVAFYDNETGAIDFPLFYNEDTPSSVPQRNINVDPSLTGAVIMQRRTLAIPDTTAPEVEAQYGIRRLGGRPTRSYVGVPLILLDQVVGVIAMQSYAAHAYQPEQVRLLETIATQAAIAVQNTRLYDQMRQMAITDSVTGLYTRRHFTALGRSEVERALRYDRQCSVLMVDLDHFKLVNDTYGHNTGDLVLQMVADVCRKALRATDIVGRWGGEEFAIVLPEADREGAALIAERIRRMMAERDIIVGEDTIHVTVSIGVTTLPECCCTLESLINGADRALYLAKQNGRNRVEFV